MLLMLTMSVDVSLNNSLQLDGERNCATPVPSMDKIWQLSQSKLPTRKN